MIRRPPRSTLDRSSAASDVYKRQTHAQAAGERRRGGDLPLAVEEEGGAKVRAFAGRGDDPLRRQAAELAHGGEALLRPGQLLDEEPAVAQRRGDIAELDALRRGLE